MQNNQRKKVYIKFALFLAPFVAIFGFLEGQNIEENGFLGFLMKPGNVFIYSNDLLPSFKWALWFLLFFAGAMFIFISTASNYRFGEEYGTSDWGDPVKLDKKYHDPDDESYNKRFTETFSLSYNNKFAQRNANALILGGSGAGKTFRYAMPNLLTAGCSFIDVDPKGEHLANAGNRLVELGYDVKVLNLTNFEESDCYNPFVYIRENEYQRDIENLVNIIFSAATNGSENKQDPFWDNQAKSVLLAIMYYVYFEYPKASQNFGAVMDIKRRATIVTGSPMQPSAPTEADPLFDELKARNPDHIALKYWNEYAPASSNVKKDVASTLNSKLSNFNNEGLVKLTRFDDMDLGSLGDRKRIIFLVISDTDTSLNFIVSIFYSQLFNTLFRVADEKYKGPLPEHVEILMDEFANIKLPQDFDKVLSTMRSRNVSASIIIQSLSQLKALYEKQWETIIDNCDTLLFLGSGGLETGKYFSELLGKYTLDTRNSSQNKGRQGSMSNSEQRLGRELLDASEIRRLDNELSLVFVRGEMPIKDNKINIVEDPAWGPFIKYSAYDKKTGKQYEAPNHHMIEAFDEDSCDLLDEVSIEKPDDLYYFVSQDELDLVNFSPRKKRRKSA